MEQVLRTPPKNLKLPQHQNELIFDQKLVWVGGYY